MSNVTHITIGSDEKNDIQYDTKRLNLNLISKEHAVIARRQERYAIEDRSTNGIFVNSVRVVGNRQLDFGDCIHIFGLCIVFLGNVLAVNHTADSVRINEKKLVSYQEPVHSMFTERRAYKEKVFYHRSPRQLYKVDKDTIEIEAPPSRQMLNKKPVGMLIGPSLTMALPMLLGCGLAMYGNRTSGSAFMYTGLVTAISSALIGTMWALLNLTFDRKKNREEELRRFEAYGEYLIKCSNKIKEKYEKNTWALRTMYLPAAECCRYNADNALLWNRNINHGDFLSHRLGIGSIPFQVTINIPRERFTLINDSLAEKPAIMQRSYKELHEVPICVDLLQHRRLGVVGGTKKRGAIEIMRNLVAQIAVSNCYTDVKMAFLYDENSSEYADMEYLKWFPHVWSEDRKTRFIARNKAEAGEVTYEITKTLRTRAENRAANISSIADKISSPQYVLFVMEPELLEGELIAKYIADENNRDLVTIFLTDTYENLPNDCDYIIQNDEHFKGMYGVNEEADERVEIAFDCTADSQLESLARVLANIEVQETGNGGDVPNALTFFEMYGIRRPEEFPVLDKWRKNRTYDNMKVLIGQKTGGAPWYLDVHEKYHGPHGLVAGTTGSGKSETLQTYILSLAMNFSPDDVGFFLIDYKGGGMAHLFDGLPHMIGQISNLSGNQVRRAMVSIKSENKRRQKIFNEHGVNNINLYTRMYKNNEATLPVPHMFIIIDEFAELKREEPEFMRELISVAQVGRSLGVHLILATQKPGGTVDDNIWSNSKFRLCLRVQDRQDSNDMLHRPDAAYITQAGRCYMQVGNDELFELFQSGYSGAVYDEELGDSKLEVARMVSVTGKAALIGSRLKLKQSEEIKKRWISGLIAAIESAVLPMGRNCETVLEDDALLAEYLKNIFDVLETQGIEYPYNEYNAGRMSDLLKAYVEILPKADTGWNDEKVREIIEYAEINQLKLPEKKTKTQLEAVIEHLAKVARENGYVHNLQLWLPVLPVRLFLKQVAGQERKDYFDGKVWRRREKKWNLSVPIGMYDAPVHQAQGTLHINLARNGHHAIVGTVVSGKSTFLQTLLYALCSKYTPDEVNIYAIDYSSGMLAAYTDMPHVGGVVSDNEDDRLAKFFDMLGDIMQERRQRFKGGNYEQYVRIHGVVLPSIVVVLDNYANFRNKTNNIYEDMILQISKEGVGYGIFLVMTAGGFSTLEIPGRIGENLRTVICLEMSDKFQYTDAMHTLHIETFPEVNIKGRGLAKVGEEILEFQTALAFDAQDDFQRMERIEKLSNVMRIAWKGKAARTIPEIPPNPVWSEFENLHETIAMAGDDCHLPIGYNTKNAKVYGIDLSRIYCYLITGKSRSGKTNLLKAILNSAMLRKGHVTVIDFGNEVIVPETSSRIQSIDTDEKLYDFMTQLKPDFVARNQRKKANVQKGMSDREIYDDMQIFDARFILIANLTDFITHVMHPEGTKEMRSFVENLLDKGSLHNVYWIACYNQDDVGKVAGMKLYEYFLRYKTGIHFGGNVAGQRIFNFDYLPYSEQSKELKPGIGMLSGNDEEDARRVVIPLVKGQAR
ncbi:MAG: DUF853 family protein [Lachnospiraceae bacterium]|nr:DUF853 family protein [Lachnospiraceae bacterium]